MFWLEGRKRKRQLEDAYLNVLERFPKVKGDEIKLIYDRKAPGSAFFKMGELTNSEGSNAIYVPRLGYFHIKPTIMVGQSFFTMESSEEQEATLAHELGHYITDKRRCGEPLLRRKTLWTVTNNYYRLNPFVALLAFYKPKVRHRMGRLRKWCTLNEIYADKAAADAGYGKPLLGILQRFLSSYQHMMPYEDRKETEARIETLEARLRQGNL